MAGQSRLVKGPWAAAGIASPLSDVSGVRGVITASASGGKILLIPLRIGRNVGLAGRRSAAKTRFP